MAKIGRRRRGGRRSTGCCVVGSEERQTCPNADALVSGRFGVGLTLLRTIRDTWTCASLISMGAEIIIIAGIALVIGIPILYLAWKLASGFRKTT